MSLSYDNGYPSVSSYSLYELELTCFLDIALNVVHARVAIGVECVYRQYRLNCHIPYIIHLFFHLFTILQHAPGLKLFTLAPQMKSIFINKLRKQYTLFLTISLNIYNYI